MDNPRSTASIAGHPIHPMLVPFPIAFFVGAFVTDLVFWQTGVAFWSDRFVLASKRGPREGSARGRCWFDRCAQRAANPNASRCLVACGRQCARRSDFALQLVWALRLGRSCRRSTRTDAFAHRRADPFVHRVERLETRLSASGRSFRQKPRGCGSNRPGASARLK